MRLGVDIGGTFTDFVLVDEAGRVRLHKRLTTPADPARSVAEGVAELAFPAHPAALVVHGSTIATNALLERRGARTALVTTAGFADVLEIGRQNRPRLYDLVPHRPPPLVPRAWRFEVRERVSAEGEVLSPLDSAEVDALVPRLQAEGIESVAVVFLFSYLRPEHEHTAKERLEVGSRKSEAEQGGLDFYISLSSDLLPEYREYERTATTVINAYVSPLMDRYLARLENELSPRPLRIMQSNGGCITAATARQQAARTALSGPAGGVVGAFAVAAEAGDGNIITFDMGGTSTDVCLCPGHIPFTSEGEIASLGLPLRLPIIDIHTVGAGGGSLARRDLGGALVVGPESAGADPGPAAYGRGGEQATVTDANVVLGRLDPAHFLGGQMRLRADAAQAALARLAAELYGEPADALPAGRLEAAAWGVLQVTNAAMERAIRRISVERGYDPADFTLVAFGGAGPLHACELAERLGLLRVLVPRAPGVLSALGMLVADLVKDYSASVLRPAAALSPGDLAALFAPWEARARDEMRAEMGDGQAARLERSLDLRYGGQSFEINVPVTDDRFELAPVLADFHARHGQRYGHAHPDEPVEVVTLRVRAVGPTPPPQFEALPPGGPDPAAALLDTRPVWFEGPAGPAPRPTHLYAREALLTGNRLPGPAVVFQMDATTVIPPGWAAKVDGQGHLLLQRAGDEQRLL